MKKTYIIILTIIIIGIIGFFIYNSVSNKSSSNQTDSSNYDAERMSTQSQNSTNTNEIKNGPNNEAELNESTETLAHFSTKLPKDTKARYSNIELACKTLNNTVVKSGDTFSLWNTIRMSYKRKRL